LLQNEGCYHSGDDVKLLVFDVEGTLFQTKIRLPGTSIDSTIWQAIADALGPSAVSAEVETHGRWHRGEYRSYLDWMKDTIRIHQQYGLTEQLFRHLIAAAEYNVGVPETLSSIDRSKYEMLLISGGFRELTARVQSDFAIRHAFAACEYMFEPGGTLAGFNLLPCDFDGKLDFIRLMLREYGLRAEEWVFVGDGINDVPIAKAAPVSIAYRGHAELRAVAKYGLDSFGDLNEILAEIV
jgi:phosphoserine phosphatase